MSSPSRLPFPYRPEAGIVASQLARLDGALDWPAVARTARPWVQAVRSHPPPFWALERLLQDYPISSAEGLALMRLAEALLRVPDSATAIALTADQLGHAAFDDAGASLLGGLSALAIGLSRKFLPEDGHFSLMSRLGARSVVAAALRAVQLLGRQFVLGETIAKATKEADHARRKTSSLRFSFDMLGEGARTEGDALRSLASYTNAIKYIAGGARPEGATELNDGISIKLSALHPRYEHAQRERVMAELVPRVWGLCERAAAANIGLTIDAEEVDRLELSLDVFEALAARVARQCPHWQGLGLALQAYQTRALDLVEHVIGIGRRYRLRLMCRLVKGAYWDAEIKRAQEMGLPHYPVFTHKHHTDVSYLACAQALLAAPDAVYPQFAGHNAATIAAIIQMAEDVAPTLPTACGSLPLTPALSPGGPGGKSDEAGDWLRQTAGAAAPSGLEPAAPKLLEQLGTGDRSEASGERRPARGNAGRVVTSVGATFELQRLHGMGEGIFREVLKNPSIRCRVYAPVGAHRELLAYLVRRLLENGANSSFVHQLADESVGMDELLTSPLRRTPESSLPLPPALYGASRANSLGLDLTVASMRAPLLAAFSATVVPKVPLFDIKLTASALDTGARSYQKWSMQPVGERAAVLRRAADALQAELPAFCALLVKEAFKTWGDAVAEVREAVDYLRYYANEAERIMAPTELPGPTGETNLLRLRPRGVWVCISPWNFPLAIFVGQVAAALVTGNAVLAKPAAQTPGVAWQAVRLLHAAGVPEGALQLLHGAGASVGAALVAAPGVAGVVFTGSTVVAKTIHRALAAKDGPIIPLIAETGGINAMLVDSTALPEQVVDAVLQSAFRSAGQRCSALRLLCVHEAIADAVIAMIRGAAQELVVGEPFALATDVGPLIDRAAVDAVQQRIQNLNSTSKVLLAQSERAPPAMNFIVNGVLPAAFEVASLAEVGDEIFGPVLQILRWQGEPAALMAQINALGYGLTLGLQTRIDSRAQALAAAAQAGNVYINRNMIGAVVGVQPFGGQGLSGTGPKAGGPHYLQRFCAEQTVTVNTTAAGGNVQLLA